ncbi:hypothetical protein [Corynebacterium pseudodiphtheriticum]|uniref:hypothetical protein n=1 Tax=Corynebacterium pseudodiphtheriticum TaxID=37637 RepID=UPI0020BE16A8|nr:hypothetical protein [Corynebacterium pseudodiphtheriticum]UQV57295.1 hypothetical protein L9H27_10110 [Corynebacterium pseudodiphtheriticum]
MGAKWDLDAAVVTRFCALVWAGDSVRAAAGVVDMLLSVAYRLAHQLQLPMRSKKSVSPGTEEEITRLWLECLAPMEIVRILSVGPSVVYPLVSSWASKSTGLIIPMDECRRRRLCNT